MGKLCGMLTVSQFQFYFKNSAPIFAETKKQAHCKLNHDKRKC